MRRYVWTVVRYAINHTMLPYFLLMAVVLSAGAGVNFTVNLLGGWSVSLLVASHASAAGVGMLVMAVTLYKHGNAIINRKRNTYQAEIDQLHQQLEERS